MIVITTLNGLIDALIVLIIVLGIAAIAEYQYVKRGGKR